MDFMLLCSHQVHIHFRKTQPSMEKLKYRVITVPTRTILHPQLEGGAITDFHSIPTSICSRTQAKKPSQDNLYI